MKLVDEINNIKWRELTNDRIKRIHVHTTLPSLMKASKCKYMHEEPGTSSIPRLFYVRVGFNDWEVHGLSWELSQFLKMQPTKSPSSKVAPIESELKDESQVKIEDEIEEVPEEVSTKTVDSDDSVETESTESENNDGNE